MGVHIAAPIGKAWQSIFSLPHLNASIESSCSPLGDIPSTWKTCCLLALGLSNQQSTTVGMAALHRVYKSEKQALR
jgi:hypothetical protein